MKRNYFDLGFGVLGVFIVVKSILAGNSTQNVFGFEMNSWIYRGIWTLITAASIYRFFNPIKK